MGPALRILLVDDHSMVRAGLHSLLANATDMAIVGEAEDGREALRMMRALVPDVVLMDISMPGMNGLVATMRAMRLAPAPKVVILSMHANEAYVSEALSAGASAYVLKNSDISEVEHAIRVVARGGRYVASALPAPLANALLREEPTGTCANRLTPRQREVLQLIAEGHATRAIAERLHLSPKTIETHRARIVERLGIRDVAGLTRYAMRTGLIAEEA